MLVLHIGRVKAGWPPTRAARRALPAGASARPLRGRAAGRTQHGVVAVAEQRGERGQRRAAERRVVRRRQLLEQLPAHRIRDGARPGHRACMEPASARPVCRLGGRSTGHAEGERGQGVGRGRRAAEAAAQRRPGRT